VAPPPGPHPRVDHAGSSRSSVIWQAVQTQVRRGITRFGSRLSVHGNIVLAPQRGQVSVFWPD